jgi:hypothetical protein
VDPSTNQCQPTANDETGPCASLARRWPCGAPEILGRAAVPITALAIHDVTGLGCWSWFVLCFFLYLVSLVDLVHYVQVCALWVGMVFAGTWILDVGWAVTPLLTQGKYSLLAFNNYPLLSTSLPEFWSRRYPSACHPFSRADTIAWSQPCCALPCMSQSVLGVVQRPPPHKRS